MNRIIAGICLFLLLSAQIVFCAEKSGEVAVESKVNRVAAMGKKLAQLLGPEPHAGLAATDPEFIAICDRLVYGEIMDSGSLGVKQQQLVSLAALTALGASAAIRTHVGVALKAGASPLEIREAIYQVTPYVGFPAAVEALEAMNVTLESHGVKLPLPDQGTVTETSRFADGLAVQKKIFGPENIEKMQANAPAGQQEIVTNYLSAFCFGDFYTRKVLDLKMRELLTFSAIVALGGCDPQARAHAGANISVGNSKQNLVDCLATLLPLIGFPKTLNGLAAVNAAVTE